MKRKKQEIWDPQIDNLGIIVAHHHYGLPVQGKLRLAPPLPYDEERDTWNFQPRRSANSIVQVKRSEIALQPRRGFWFKLFGQ